MPSLAPLTNLPHLVNNKKQQLDNETSESVDWSLWTEINFIEIYNKNVTKLTKITYSFSFFHLQNVSKSLDYLKLSKNQRERIKKKLFDNFHRLTYPD